MTTRVPDGTSEEAVEEIRTREAHRSRVLAAEGLLLRLWRPPLQPSEWRTLGLFAADNETHLESTLSSMPLRVWRTDEVTPLSPHPNDPARGTDPSRSLRPQTGKEFLTTFTLTVPSGTPVETIHAARASEAERSQELAEQGRLVRLWKLPDDERSLGLWQASDATEMQTILASLPLSYWMSVETLPLSPHPNDPALGTS